MLEHYRTVLALRHRYQTNDTSLRWLEDYDHSSSQPDGANGQHGGVIAYARANGWANITNFGSEPVGLPEGEILLTSQPLDEQGHLPQDTSAWILLAQ